MSVCQQLHSIHGQPAWPEPAAVKSLCVRNCSCGHCSCGHCRVAQAKTALQLVAFYRWDEFKAYAKASGHAWPFAAELLTEFEDFVAALSTPSHDGSAVSKVEASLAPDGSPNKGGSVTFKELRTQLGI